MLTLLFCFFSLRLLYPCCPFVSVFASDTQLILQRLQQIESQQSEINNELSRLPAIQEDMHANTAILQYIPSLLSSLVHHTFNPYTESVISVDRDPQFRVAVVAHYYPQSVLPLPAASSSSSCSSGPVAAGSRIVKDAHGKVACMVSGELGSHTQVIAAHIHPHCSPIDTLNYAGLTRAEVDSVRNALLLADGIEKAFDRLDISFVPLSPVTPDRFVLKIWTSAGLAASGVVGKKGYHIGDVRPLPIWNSKKQQHSIGEYEGSELLYGPSSSAPLRRALSYQAWLAYDRALKQGWVSSAQEPPPDFGTPNDSPFQRQRRLSLSSSSSRGQEQEQEE